MLAVWDSMRGREECSHIVTKGVCFVMIILRPSIFLPSARDSCLVFAQRVKNGENSAFKKQIREINLYPCISRNFCEIQE